MSTVETDAEASQTPTYTELRASHHVRHRWGQRSSQPNLCPRIAWLEAVPIHYPSIKSPAKHARLHEVTEMLLLAGDEQLVTCIPLEDRPRSEQQYIRDQLEASDE